VLEMTARNQKRTLGFLLNLCDEILMKTYSLVFVGLCTLLLATSSCNSKDKPSAPTTISAAETMGLLKNDFATLVDLRNPEQAKSDTPEKAKSVAPSNIASLMDSLPKDKQVILIPAESPEETQKAGATLNQHGYKTSILEDFEGLKKAGLQLKNPASP
jgi:rhodanese-related sulfurtransferase